MERDDERLLYSTADCRQRADRARGRGPAWGAAAEDSGEAGVARPDGDSRARQHTRAPRTDVDVYEAGEWRAAHRVVAARSPARLVRHQLRWREQSV